MTTLTDRPKTDLVVIDVQNGVIAGTAHRDAVIANIALLVDQARAESGQVINHTNLYWESHTAPRQKAGTVSTGSVLFS